MENLKQGNEKKMEKKNQPIKLITYQDLHEVSDLLEQLKSWLIPLELVKNYFSDQSRPVNKKKIVREYYACSQLFISYHLNNKKLLKMLDKRIVELSNREKL